MTTADGDFAREETCATCGGFLSRTGPKGGCLRCLLGIAFDTDGGPSAASLPYSQAGEPPRRSYGHFSIDLDPEGLPVELGSGATATTYRARDLVLHSAVALKVTNKNVIQRPAARERFLREARAAAKLRHPNIASVSHYGEEEGECYYAMELIEGETLEARVRRDGPLPAAVVLEVGVQVTRALAAAEVYGLVHRDLKPSNLMLTTPPNRSDDNAALFVVKVIDWGLAKTANDDPVLGANHTRDSFVGTPAFASPEQFVRNEDRRIDMRSDIYSLGVTLWYLVCGRTPFVGDTLEAIRAQQEKPPFDQLASQRTPGPMVNLLASLLAPDPTARPQSSRELLDRLQRCQQQITAEERWSEGRLKRWWLIVACIGLTLLATGIGVRWHQLPPVMIPLGCSVAVLSFEEPGVEGTKASFARGLRDEVARNLARVAAFRVVVVNGESSVGLTDQDLRRLGGSLGVRFVLAGSVHREGEHVQVRTRLLETGGSHLLWSEHYDRRRNDVFSVPGTITQSVADYLGVKLTAAEQAAVAVPLTADAAAYELYTRVHYEKPACMSETESDRYQTQVAIPSLEAAVKIDPKFTLAYCDLAAAHGALIQCEPATKQAETHATHRLQAEAALAEARRLRSDDGEVHLAQARHFSNISRDPVQARAELDLARRELPDSVAVESLAGEIAYNQNRWEEAVHCFERAVVLDPHDLEVRWFLTNLYHSLRRCGDGEEAAAQFIALRPNDSLAAGLDRTLYSLEARADLAPLQVALSTVTPSGQPQVDIVDRYHLLLALFTHDPDEVSRVLAHMGPGHIRIRGVSYHKAWFAALAARLRGDADCARREFAKARKWAEFVVQIEPTNGRALGLLAMIDAGLGDRDKAVREARYASELCTVDTAADQAPIVACDLAVVYAWTDQPELACAVLEEWSQRPAGFNLPRQPTYGDLKLNPLWIPLREHPRFVALTARLAPPASR